MRNILIFILSFNLNCTAQNNIKVNLILEMNKDLLGVSEALDVWLKFLNCENDSIASKYWNQDEINAFGSAEYFKINELNYFELDDIVHGLQLGTTVLTITREADFYKITSQLNVTMGDGAILVPYIFHVYAKRELASGSLKLYNPEPINCALQMKQQQVRNINYVYPITHDFNKKIASKQANEIKNLAKNLGVSIPKMTFVFTSTREELLKLQGYDYHFSTIGKELPSGKANVETNLVYSYGTDEYYPHELIHLIVTPNFPLCHGWLNEGVATFFGGSRGKSLEYHLLKTRNYLKLHPEVDLNNVLKSTNLDDETDFRYVIGGFLVKQTIMKGGFELLKKLISGGQSDDAFYSIIEEVLGIEKQNLGEYIRKNL